MNFPAKANTSNLNSEGPKTGDSYSSKPLEISMDSQDPGQSATQQPAAPQHCKNITCMFFGNSSCEGYCSVCFKDVTKKRKENEKGNKDNDAATSHQLNSSSGVPINPAVSNQNERLSSITQIQNTLSRDQTGTSMPVDITTSANTIVPSSTLTPPAIASSLPNPIKLEKRRNDDSYSSTVSTPEKYSTEGDKDNNGSPSKPKKRRCGVCKKKIGLTGFECRCGNLYCAIHRYADKHECSYNYQKEERSKLAKDNPVVQDEKIQKI